MSHSVENDVEKLRGFLRQGNSCSVALMMIGLEHKGSENPELLDVMQAFGSGMSSGLICGALTGGAAMLCLLLPDEGPTLVQDLVEWFDATYGEEYGGCDCDDILGDNPMRRMQICPDLVVDVYRQARELLEFAGYPFQD